MAPPTEIAAVWQTFSEERPLRSELRRGILDARQRFRQRWRAEQTSREGLRVGVRFVWDKVDQIRSFLVLSRCIWHPCLLLKSFAKMCSSFGVTAIFVLASSERPLCWSDPGSEDANICS